MVDERPEIDYLCCPVGGGSSAAGCYLTVGALATEVVSERLDDFRLVSETGLERGVRDLFRAERIPTEGAYAASLAAMRRLSDELAGQTVVFPVSGRNIDAETFTGVLAADDEGVLVQQEQ